MRLLDSVVLPRGALQVSADPSSPPRFGRRESTLALPHVVDVRRFWRLPGTVTSAANWFQSHPPAGGRLMSSEAAGTGRARSGRPRLSILTMWGGTYTFASAPPGLTAQQLTIALAPARGGGVAVRADGQAGWLPPRPVAEQIPDTVTRIGVAYITRTDLRSRGSASTSSTETRLETFDLTSRDRIRQMVSALNVLPHAARSVQPCSRRRGTEIALVFYGIDRRTRLASARILPNCTALVLAINGRPPQTLSLAAPAVGPPLLAILKPPLTSTTTTSTSSATSTSPASTTASSTSTASTTSTTSR
jgi:hypothetical protein